MNRRYLHEEIYRGTDALEMLSQPQLVICGAGAIGSHLLDNLTRQGFRRLRVIDRDRVEEHNAGTQIFDQSDVGAWKVEILRNRIFRSVDIEIDAVRKELTQRNAASLLKGADIVVDAFDNSDSRRLVQQQCRQAHTQCLHVGLYADYCEAIWDERYRVPADVAGDVCEYPLARNLVLFSVALASELLIRFVLHTEKRDYSGTLADFAIREVER